MVRSLTNKNYVNVIMRIELRFVLASLGSEYVNINHKIHFGPHSPNMRLNGLGLLK